jgi:hypothetical protein
MVEDSVTYPAHRSYDIQHDRAPMRRSHVRKMTWSVALLGLGCALMLPVVHGNALETTSKVLQETTKPMKLKAPVPVRSRILFGKLDESTAVFLFFYAFSSHFSQVFFVGLRAG